MCVILDLRELQLDQAVPHLAFSSTDEVVAADVTPADFMARRVTLALQMALRSIDNEMAGRVPGLSFHDVLRFALCRCLQKVWLSKYSIV